MKNIIIAIFFYVSVPFALMAASSSLEVPFSGDLSDSGISITGNVHMKFVLGNAGGTATYWSQDGSVAGAVAEPTGSVTVGVENGIFSVWLGDSAVTGMNALTSTVFDSGDVYLRVWVSTNGTTFTAFSSKFRMDASAFAVRASQAGNAEKLGNITPGATGLALLDDPDTATARTTLGLGTAAGNASGDFASSSHGHNSGQISGLGSMATQNSAAVSVTGGSVKGVILEATSANLAGLAYPSADGSAGQVLTTNGSGNLAFTTISNAGQTYTNAVIQSGNFTGNISGGAIASSQLNSTPIGSTSPSTGVFTTLTTTGSTNLNGIIYPNSAGSSGQVVVINGTGHLGFQSISGTIYVGANLLNNESILGNWDNTANPWADNEVVDALTINGGTVNNSPVGATTPSTGAFTTLSANGNMGIGTSTPAARLDVGASTTSLAALRIREGATPVSPQAGDIYTSGGNLFYYNGSAWVSISDRSSLTSGIATVGANTSALAVGLATVGANTSVLATGLATVGANTSALAANYMAKVAYDTNGNSKADDADKLAGVTPSAYGLTLIDDADAAVARTTLGLGTASVSSTTDFASSIHSHVKANISDIGTAAGNASTDFAASSHGHAATAITSGTLDAARLPMMVGDSGTGGTQGAVPAPGAGDAAAGKFLKADGSWAAPGPWVASSGNAVLGSGNTGVGDVTPDALLEISQSGGSNAPFMISSDDNNDGDRLMVNGSGNFGLGTTTPTSRLHVNGSSSSKVTTVTANYNAADDSVILINDSSGNIIISLPATANCSGRQYTFKKISSGNNEIIIQPNGSETIDGSGNLYMYVKHDSVKITNDGSNWWVIEDNRFNPSPYDAIVSNTIGKGNFSRIQDAVDAGHKYIFVRNGVYTGNIIVGRTDVELQGESNLSTKIDGQLYLGGNSLANLCANISVRNFCIYSDSYTPVEVKYGANVLLENCIAKGPSGSRTYNINYTKNVTFERCTALSGASNGFTVATDALSTRIINCSVVQVGFGIVVRDTARSTLISGCYFYGMKNTDVAIWVQGNANGVVINSSIIKNFTRGAHKTDSALNHQISNCILEDVDIDIEASFGNYNNLLY